MRHDTAHDCGQHTRQVKRIAARWSVNGLIVAVLAADCVAATGPPVPRPGDKPLPAPRIETRQSKILPRVEPPAATDDGRFSDGLAVRVTSYRFTGNSVIDDATLQAIAAPYSGRLVASGELETLRQLLSAAYTERGYINSGAVFPDQDLANGIVTVRIVEGQLTEIALGDIGRLPGRFVAGYLDFAGKPLNVNDVEARLRELQNDPRVQSLRAELRPGTKAGDGRLAVSVAEPKRWRFGANLNNGYSPSIGETRLGLTVDNFNLTGLGDVLVLDAGAADGLIDFTGRYSVPLAVPRMQLVLGYDYSEIDIVEEPFDDLDITGRTSTWLLGIEQGVPEFPVGKFSFGFRVERRDSRNWLLDTPFSFSEGAHNGESRVTVLRAQQDWTWQAAQSAVGVRSVFSAGIDAFGATVNDAGVEDGKFFAWLGQAVWARRFGDGTYESIARVSVQLANDPLLPMEQFAIGGGYSVRGYRENQVVRDRGAHGSIELRRAILRGLEGAAVLQLAAFVDHGRAWNHGRGRRDRVELTSAGAGLRFRRERYSGHLYWAADLEDVEAPEDRGLQDHGWHFRLEYRL